MNSILRKQLYQGLFAFCLASIPFIAQAQAEASADTSMTSSALTQGGLLVVFGLVFYFLLIRPQSKRAKEQKNLIDNLQKGDEVITAGGLVGRISRVAEQFCVITIAEGVEVTIQKQAISLTLPKGTMKSL